MRFGQQLGAPARRCFSPAAGQGEARGTSVRRLGPKNIALLVLLLLAACDSGSSEAGGAPPASSTLNSDASVASAASPSSSGGAAIAPASASVAPPATSSSAALAPERRCPLEMERIGGYCIDKWEAHLVSKGRDGREVVHPRNIPPQSGAKFRFEARSAPGVWPQAHISRGQAENACKAAGKRMCAWIEWRRACQGPKWKRWPYGNKLQQGFCNSGKDHLIRKLFGDDPNKWEQKHFNDPRLNEQSGFLAKTGAHPECVSPDGLFDMVGNLHEWVIDSVSSTFVRKMKEEGMSREKQPFALGNAMFLGGFYSTRSEHGMGCYFVTIAHSKKYFDYSTGFRCCKDARKAESSSPP